VGGKKIVGLIRPKIGKRKKKRKKGGKKGKGLKGSKKEGRKRKD